MNQLRTYVCVLATLLSAGCAAASGQTQAASRQAPAASGQAPAAGHLAGRLVMEGGPLGPGGKQPGERPLSGTVTFTAAGHRRVTVRVGSSGRFSVQLPIGTYRVSGASPAVETSSGSSGKEQELPCSQPLSATVTAGHTSAVTVACVVP
jgi:hypothetical protein